MRKVITIVLLIVLTSCLKSYAAEEPTLIKMHSTAYCLQGQTCTGEYVREGIAASGRKDLIGKTIILYQRLPNNELGKGLGIFEVIDSGCGETIIDVWMPDLDACQEWMDLVYSNGCNGKVYCQVIEDSNG